MEAEFQQPKRREAVISTLNGAVGTMNLAEKISSIAPAKVAFGSVGTLLMLIRVRFLIYCNDPFQVYTYLGLNG